MRIFKVNVIYGELDIMEINRREMSSEEIKETAFNILKYLDNVCKENNLRYYVSGRYKEKEGES